MLAITHLCKYVLTTGIPDQYFHELGFFTLNREYYNVVLVSIENKNNC